MRVDLHTELSSNNYKSPILFPKNNVGSCLLPKVNLLSFQKRPDLLSLKKDVFCSTIETSIRDRSNFIGEGCEGRVFQVPRTQYCVKVPIETLPDKVKLKSYEGKSKLSVKDKINHVVARLGQGIVLMTRIKGLPIGKSQMSAQYAKELSTQVSELPQDAYKNLLYQIAYAYKNGMLFDAFNHNVILNGNDHSVVGIDFINNEGALVENLSPLQSMYSSLINRETTAEQKANIAKNILEVSLNEMAPNHEPCMDVYDFDFTEFIYMMQLRKVLQLPKEVYSYFDELTFIKNQRVTTVESDNNITELINKIKSYL